MKLVKLACLLVVVVGLALLAVAYAPSISGHPSDSGSPGASKAAVEPEREEQADRTNPRRERGELTVLAGRGTEIGVSVRDLDASDKAQAGVIVEDVRSESPAEKAGLKRADIIQQFDGEAVRSARQFTRLVREAVPGRTVKATVVRDGARKDVQITPVEGRDSLIDGDRIREKLGDLYDRLPPFNFDFDLPYPFESRGRLGVTVQELTPQLAAYFGAKNGVLVTAVTDDGPAARAGLKAGDVITRVNDAPVRSREDLVRALRDIKDDGQATIGIVRDKRETTATVRLETRKPGRTGRPA